MWLPTLYAGSASLSLNTADGFYGLSNLPRVILLLFILPRA